jgi:hypothetical protein
MHSCDAVCYIHETNGSHPGENRGLETMQLCAHMRPAVYPPLSNLLQMTWDLFRVQEPSVLSSKVENFSQFWQHFQDQNPSPGSPKFPPNRAKTVFAENHNVRG